MLLVSLFFSFLLFFFFSFFVPWSVDWLLAEPAWSLLLEDCVLVVPEEEAGALLYDPEEAGALLCDELWSCCASMSPPKIRVETKTKNRRFIKSS